MKNLRKMLKNEKGFTLVELVVVIAILGLLIAIAVPRFANITENARKKSQQATARTIMSAIVMAQAADPNKALTDIKAVDVNPFLESIEVVDAAEDKKWSFEYDDTNKKWKFYYGTGTDNQVEITE